MFLIHLDEFHLLLLLLLLLWGKWKQMNVEYMNEWIIEYIVFHLAVCVCDGVYEGKSNITLEFH